MPGVSFNRRGLELSLACCASWPDVVLNWWMEALAWKFFLQTIFNSVQIACLSSLPSEGSAPGFWPFYFWSQLEICFSSSSSKPSLQKLVCEIMYKLIFRDGLKVHCSNVLAMFRSEVNTSSERIWNLVAWNPWLQNVGSLRCRPELCVSDKSWVRISSPPASVFASDLFLPSAAGRQRKEWRTPDHSLILTSWTSVREYRLHVCWWRYWEYCATSPFPECWPQIHQVCTNLLLVL
jgi:hypothetical protein